jgi:hypothetical protein
MGAETVTMTVPLMHIYWAKLMELLMELPMAVCYQ